MSRLLLNPKPGFDWSAVNWEAPDAPRSEVCSLCATAIADDDVPLMLWTEAGACAQFCDACVSSCFDGEVERD